RGVRRLRRRVPRTRDERETDRRRHAPRATAALRRYQVRARPRRPLHGRGHLEALRVRGYRVAQPSHPDASRGDRSPRARRRRVAADFDPEHSQIARFGVRELVAHATIARKDEVDGPVSRYLRTTGETT